MKQLYPLREREREPEAEGVWGGATGALRKEPRMSIHEMAEKNPTNLNKLMNAKKKCEEQMGKQTFNSRIPEKKLFKWLNLLQ